MLSRGFVGGLLVLVGGMVGATIPGSSRWQDVTPLVVLRGSESGRMLGLAVVMLGLGLLALQWLRLCRLVGESRNAEDGDRDEALALVRSAVVVWSVPLLLAPPLFSRDGWSYAAQGAVGAAGLSPYEHGPGVLSGPLVEGVDPMWMESAAPYGPVPLWLGELMASINDSPWLLVVGHRMLALVGLALLAWSVPRMARWCGVDPALASALALASPFMIANGVAGLHNDLLMAGLSAAALVLAVERGWLVGAVVAGTAAAVKAPGGMVAIAVVLVTLPAGVSLVRRLGRLAAVAAVAGGTLVAWGLVTGLGLGWVDALSVPQSITTPMSLTALVDELFVSGLARKAGTVLTMVVAAVLVLRRPTGDRGSAVATAAMVTVVTVLLSPVVHIWYVLWCLPFVAAAPLHRVGRGLFVAASIILGLCAPLDSSLHGAFVVIWFGIVLCVVLVLALLLTRTGRQRVRDIVAHSAPA